MADFDIPEKLQKHHDLRQFDCGKPSLNQWLQKYALENQNNGSVRVYVICKKETNVVLGYFAIAPGSVDFDETPKKVSKDLARHRVPVMLLARLAVDTSLQGQRIGKALLKQALLKIDEAADIIGGRAVLVHAIDQEAEEFYRHHGFEPSPVADETLFLLMKDMRATLKPAIKEEGK